MEVRSAQDPKLIFKELTLNTLELDGDPVKEKIAGVVLLFLALILFLVSGVKAKEYWDKIKPKKKHYEY